MTDTAIHPTRIVPLNDKPYHADGRYVLYWMQQSQRATFNHALEYAIEDANARGLPVLVCFGLMDTYPDANVRHYTFMLEGLADVADRLRRRGIRCIARNGAPPDVAEELSQDAATVICDRGYLRHQRAWRRQLAEHATCRVIQVESDVIVPVDTASDKVEFAARTIRRKLQRHLDTYLVDLPAARPAYSSLGLDLPGLDVSNPADLLSTLRVDRSVSDVSRLYKGGQSEAEKRFNHFLMHRFSGYAVHRNQPQTNDVSHMSKYLHFGQISPVWLALQVKRNWSQDSGEAFIEELLVRRELCMNFTTFNSQYDSYAGLPAWARKTLDEHREDKRQYIYRAEDLEQSKTHDPYWNAAMKEMRETGYMHNYMRMYWGKKI
ncbi:MAG: deoxyribodipyrimidine photo-lyase, partial [Candidatus Pacebacteria bacterium]|nr:deoxyribodipyrimidine photo-lyase [Candidatus Paceibacterota bacterium]